MERLPNLIIQKIKLTLIIFKTDGNIQQDFIGYRDPKELFIDLRDGDVDPKAALENILDQL